MSSAYINKLIRQTDEANAKCAALAAERNKPLTVKIREWWTALSIEQRYRPYSMDELVKIFNAAPGRIGLALAELGWLRRRAWTEINYKRYWIALK